MIVSEKVRAARKDAQLKRLEKKQEAVAAEDPESYSKFYAAQPLQAVKAEQNERIRLARVAVANAMDAVQFGEVTGESLAESRTALQNSVIELAQAEAAKRAGRGGGATLTEARP